MNEAIVFKLMNSRLQMDGEYKIVIPKPLILNQSLFYALKKDQRF